MCDAICGILAGPQGNPNPTPNTHLTSLNFSCNELGLSAASAVAKALAGSKVLVNVNLYGNQICDKGAQKLCWALEHNTNLKSLNLFENKITAQGASDLAIALQKRIDNQQTALERTLMDAKSKGKLCADRKQQDAYASLDTINVAAMEQISTWSKLTPLWKSKPQACGV